jgi:hypothetical protein
MPWSPRGGKLPTSTAVPRPPGRWIPTQPVDPSRWPALHQSSQPDPEPLIEPSQPVRGLPGPRAGKCQTGLACRGRSGVQPPWPTSTCGHPPARPRVRSASGSRLQAHRRSRPRDPGPVPTPWWPHGGRLPSSPAVTRRPGVPPPRTDDASPPRPARARARQSDRDRPHGWLRPDRGWP